MVRLTLEPDGWRSEMVLGEALLLGTHVEAEEGEAGDIRLTYSSDDPAVLRVEAVDDRTARVTAVGLGTATLTVALAGDAGGVVQAAPVDVEVTSVLAEVAWEPAGADPVVFTALGDTAVLRARALDVDSATVSGAGLEWAVGGTGVVELLVYPDGDSARVVARGPGTDTVRVTHPFCLAPCGLGRAVEVRQEAAELVVVPAEVTLASGDSLTLEAEARDRRGILITDADVTWETTDPEVAEVDSAGTVRAKRAGETEIIARVDTVAATAAVVVTAGAPARLAFTVQPTDAQAGGVITPAVEVTVRDAFGNAVTGATGEVTLSIGADPGDGALDGTTTVTPSDGVAVFDDLSIDEPGDDYTLVARSGTLTAAASDGFDVDNDVPTASDDAYTTDEDVAVTVPAPGVLGNDDDGHALEAELSSGPTNGSLALADDGSFTYTPAAGFIGVDRFTYRASDEYGGTDAATATITVTAVNDAPTFTAGADQTVAEDAGAQTVAEWATAIDPGPGESFGPGATFNVTANTNPGLFAAGPAVALDGTLTYTPATNANGSADITLALADGEGGSSAGVTFTLTVTSVIDSMTFNYTGAQQSFTVPTGVTELTIAAYGAEGGQDTGGLDGGKGGSVTATVPVAPGETLAIFVGGRGANTPDGAAGGFNGGGAGGLGPFTRDGAGGGGASDVRQGGADLDDRIVVAGGGGGEGASTYGSYGTGGAGGSNTIGGNGQAGRDGYGAGGGGGGTQTGGGYSGGSGGGGGAATAGALGVGGTGAGGARFPGAGGGGGYYGGGGGSANDFQRPGGGGGGGSSYVIGTATDVSSTRGTRSGDGLVVITW